MWNMISWSSLPWPDGNHEKCSTQKELIPHHITTFEHRALRLRALTQQRKERNKQEKRAERRRKQINSRCDDVLTTVLFTGARSAGQRGGPERAEPEEQNFRTGVLETPTTTGNAHLGKMECCRRVRSPTTSRSCL